MTRSSVLSALLGLGILAAVGGHGASVVAWSSGPLWSVGLVLAGAVVFLAGVWRLQRRAAVAGAVLAVGGLVVGVGFPVEAGARLAVFASAGGLWVAFEAAETRFRFASMSPEPSREVRRGIVRGLSKRLGVVAVVGGFVVFSPLLLAPWLPPLVVASVETFSAWGVALQGLLVVLALVAYGGLVRARGEASSRE